MVKARSRIPDTGDIAWLNFSPQAGHEQAGRRPALVLSPARYNGTTSMMICCPMTTQVKGYPFEVVVSEHPPSAILADQVKSLDWRVRGALAKGRVPESVMAEVRAKIRALIGA
jgi:mRNA interferase MazF